MPENWDVVVVGSGNAALCAAIAAKEQGRRVLVIEKADPDLAGGNSKYTAGAMRFVYNTNEDLLPLLQDPRRCEAAEHRLRTVLGRRSSRTTCWLSTMAARLSSEQKTLIGESYDVVRWLASHDVKFEPIYSRQSFQKDGRHIFWGGLTLAAEERRRWSRRCGAARLPQAGGEIRYDLRGGRPDRRRQRGRWRQDPERPARPRICRRDAVILGCGGFEANAELRTRFIGKDWAKAKVRGTPHNTGKGLEMAFKLGAQPYGLYDGLPRHADGPAYARLRQSRPAAPRAQALSQDLLLPRRHGQRERRTLRRRRQGLPQLHLRAVRSAVLEQPNHLAWQIFDARSTTCSTASTSSTTRTSSRPTRSMALIDEARRHRGQGQACAPLSIDFNAAVNADVAFDPTTKDGKNTHGLVLPKSNWAQKIDTAPFKAYPVTGGITSPMAA